MYKIKNGFISQKVADEWMVVAVGKLSEKFNNIITLNESAYLMWEGLKKGNDEHGLAMILTENYDITESDAQNESSEFIEKLMELDCIEKIE